jgi:hypothetical protein
MVVPDLARPGRFVTPDGGADRVADGAIWGELCATLEQAGDLVLGEGVPASPADRAEGFRYLLRFLAAGINVCVEHADPDHPEFTRMMDLRERWGLDNPDCLYLFASVRGGAEYRVCGDPGTAAHLDLQVNAGHYAMGAVEGVRTIGSLAGHQIERARDGTIDVRLGGAPAERNWIPLAADAEFVLFRQLFLDWEAETPARITIERLGGPVSEPRVAPAEVAARMDRLRSWLRDGGRLWENLSRVMLSIPPNTLRVAAPERSAEHSGTADQVYAMGNFTCGPDEAVLLEYTPPACRYWGVSLATWWWEAIDFCTRQSSLNAHQARLDADGVFRAVIAHRDPGVPNWLDTAGHERGTLIARFLLAETAPSPSLRRVKLESVRSELPADTPPTTPEEREASLARRRRAVWLRFRR